MAELYSDENFHYAVVAELRRFGHDVSTAFEAGQAGQRIPDSGVLAFAISQCRAVLTHNRKHFIRLHKQSPNHHGVIVCTYDDDFTALAQRIHRAIQLHDPLNRKLVRVNRPAQP